MAKEIRPLGGYAKPVTFGYSTSPEPTESEQGPARTVDPRPLIARGFAEATGEADRAERVRAGQAETWSPSPDMEQLAVLVDAGHKVSVMQRLQLGLYLEGKRAASATPDEAA